jgi:hypothetical protein
MARKTAEEREDLRQHREKQAWRYYCRYLGQLDELAAAMRLANGGPDGKEPGERLYHNLGVFLHWCVDEATDETIRPSADEKTEFLKFLQRVEAAGKELPRGSALFEKQWIKGGWTRNP